MTRLLLLSGFAACMCAFSQAPYYSTIRPALEDREIPINQGSAALWQSLKKLHTRASLIMVTAHPDDEDGGMLAYESRGRGTRVALLTLNRGEGGANVMSLGPSLSEPLAGLGSGWNATSGCTPAPPTIVPVR